MKKKKWAISVLPQLRYNSFRRCGGIEFTSYVNGKIITYYKYRITLYFLHDISNQLFCNLVQNVKIYFSLCTHFATSFVCDWYFRTNTIANLYLSPWTVENGNRRQRFALNVKRIESTTISFQSLFAATPGGRERKYSQSNCCCFAVYVWNDWWYFTCKSIDCRLK